LKLTGGTGLVPYEVGALTVLTLEMLRDANINMELWIRDYLVRTLAQAVDQAFIDSSNSGSANVKPAAVTNGVSVANSPSESLFDWADEFTGNPATAVICLNPFTAARIQSANRPYVGALGGSLGGWPVITSQSVLPEDIVLIDGSGIAVALGTAWVRMSDNAAVEFDSASGQTSDGPVAASGLTSLWQCNSRGYIAAMQANWRNTRPGSVAVFNVQSYGL
jgi:hypothetical protein